VFLLKKSEKILKTKLKGAVLLLVMTVMFMLMILLMATLAVVSNSNKKAYVKFEENQAYYTAASALEVFWNGGVLTDSKFYAVDGAAPKPYVSPDGTSSNVLTQGRDIELELYKLKPVNSIASYTNIASKTTNVSDLVEYIEQYDDLGNAAGMGGDAAGKYGEQFVQPQINPSNALAYYVEFPEISSPTAGDFGRFADKNPNAAAGTAPQMASIKIEVIERYYDLAGVTQADLMAFLKYNPDDYGGPGEPPVPATVPAPPTAIADAAGTKIDATKLADALKAGDRAKDYFKVRITSESVLMGVKGSAAVELSTGTVVQTLPQGDTAIKSFGFSADNDTGYGAIGGASGLSDIMLKKARVNGMAYSEGNIRFYSTQSYVMSESSTRPDSGATGPYIESKAHYLAKSWFSSDSAGQKLTSQAPETFIYAQKGVKWSNEHFSTAGIGTATFITNGAMLKGAKFNLPGNLVAGELGKQGTFSTASGEAINIDKSAYIGSLYLDDLTAAGDSLGANSFAMAPQNVKVGVAQTDKTLYVRDIYLNFPASEVKDPSTYGGATWDPDTGVRASASGISTPSAMPKYGYYDKSTKAADGTISPFKISSDATVTTDGKWLINTKLDTAGFDKIVFSGKVYFRDYSVAGYDAWVGYNWTDLDGANATDHADDWFWFIDGTVQEHKGGNDTNQWYSLSTAQIYNNTRIKYAAPTDTTVFTGVQEFAWDINTDVSNATHGNYKVATASAVTPGTFTTATEKKYYNTNGNTRIIAANITDPSAAPYSFDSDSGHVYLRMPFKTTAGTNTNRAILKFDTPQSLYKEYFANTAVFNTGTYEPIDKDNNGYMTYNPGDPGNSDVLGYGMLMDRFVGPFKYNKSTKKYSLTANPSQPDDAAQVASSASDMEQFGYMFYNPDGLTGYGIDDLVMSAEDKAGAAAFALTNVVFYDPQVPTTLPTPMQVPSLEASGTTMSYTSLITTSGVTKKLSGTSPYDNLQTDSTSIVNIVDATTSSPTILLEPTDGKVTGTYIVDGDKNANFIIKGGQGTVTLGNTGESGLNIVSSKNLKHFSLSTSSTNNGSRSIVKTGMLGVGSSPVLTGSNANASTRTTSSFITVYVGEGTDVVMKAGVIDGTLYAPDSYVTFGENESPNLSTTKFNTQQPTSDSVGTYRTAVLGTIICSTIQFDKEQLVVFVANSGGSTPDPGIPQFAWNPVAYTANAAGS
jgi:hypothetical protein